MVQLLWKIVWCFLKKLNIGLPYDAAIPLRTYPKKMKIEIPTATCILMFIAALFTIDKKWKQPPPSTDD